MKRIGILRETKVKTDNRTPIVPADVRRLLDMWRGQIEVLVQPSDIRCYTDDEYRAAGAIVTDNLSCCDYVFGVKEPRPSSLIEGMHYFFFGHIREDKPYEYPLIRALVEKKCTLTDYDLLMKNVSIKQFSIFAGFVGAYNALRLYGLRNNLYDLPPAQYCGSRATMIEKVLGVADIIQRNKVKVVITGRSAAYLGAATLLDYVMEIDPTKEEFFGLDKAMCYSAVSLDTMERVDKGVYTREEYHRHPELYRSKFGAFVRAADILIACHSWEMDEPVLLTYEMVEDDYRRLSVISDVVADINGSICTTIRHSSHADPFYDVNPHNLGEEFPFLYDDSISVCAVDTLPNALPKEASDAFSKDLCTHVIDDMFNKGMFLFKENLHDYQVVTGGVITERCKHLESMLLDNMNA